jgi:hypothetical protein
MSKRVKIEKPEDYETAIPEPEPPKPVLPPAPAPEPEPSTETETPTIPLDPAKAPDVEVVVPIVLPLPPPQESGKVIQGEFREVDDTGLDDDGDSGDETNDLTDSSMWEHLDESIAAAINAAPKRHVAYTADTHRFAVVQGKIIPTRAVELAVKIIKIRREELPMPIELLEELLSMARKSKDTAKEFTLTETFMVANKVMEGAFKGHPEIEALLD